MNLAPPKFYYVYILKSCKENWIYIGFTSGLSRRLKEHYSGENRSTRRYLPVELVYYEAFRSIDDAKNREKNLKVYSNALRLLKRRVKSSLNVGGAG